MGKGFSQKISVFLMALFILLSLVFGVMAFHAGSLARGLLGSASPAFLLIPFLLGKVTRRAVWLNGILFVFLSLSYAVGCVYQGFDRFPYYDKIAHFLSGIVFTICGLCLFLWLCGDHSSLAQNWLLTCAFAFFFSTFIAVFWEVVEFAGFVLFKHDSQHHLTTGVFDTMEDMIACLLGNLLCVASCALYVKRRIKLLTGAALAEFETNLLPRKPR